jgi:hypothetical protein
MGRWLSLGAVLATLAVPAPASVAPAAEHSLYPKEVMAAAGDEGAPFARMREIPLWTPQAARGFKQRIRLIVGGFANRIVMIRIDETAGGRRIGYVRVVLPRWAQGAGDEPTIVDDGFGVRDADYKELLELIDKSDLWTIYPEFWVLKPSSGEICIDGEPIVFERVNAQGYRYSEGNAQCTLAPKQLAVAAKLIQMSGQRDQEWLLH